MTQTKNIHAQALAKLGASKGGLARAASMTPEERSAQARRAYETRRGGESPHRLTQGERRGKIVLLEAVMTTNKQGHQKPSWRCRCDCGNDGTYEERDLIHKNRQSCGCAKRNAAHSRSPEVNKAIAQKMAAARYAKHVPASHQLAVGERYGRLVLVAQVLIDQADRKDRPGWVCQCDCGNTHEVTENNLVGGNVSSCGCLRRELNTSAGGDATPGDVAPEHNVWSNMISRCTNPAGAAWNDYGGRGITVCPQWRDPVKGYLTFLADVGRKPTPEHSIDRIDVDGNYEPGNVRWATAAEQRRNQRRTKMLTHEGKTQCATDWSRETGLPVTTIIQRMKCGQSSSDCLRPLNTRATGANPVGRPPQS